jgi:hypothetical protein
VRIVLEGFRREAPPAVSTDVALQDQPSGPRAPWNKLRPEKGYGRRDEILAKRKEVKDRTLQQPGDYNRANWE